MNKRVLIRGVVSLAILLAVASGAYAGWYCCTLQARGDWQLLRNDDEGAEVRVWVVNSCRSNHQALVTVVAQLHDGSWTQRSATLFVPRHSTRPVSVYFDGQIHLVSKLIVTKLGG